MKEIILASASKRRSEILSLCGIKYKVVPAGITEVLLKNKSAEETVTLNAVSKAEKVSQSVKGIVIGADTLVVQGSAIIGKPADENEAKEMLSSFSGKEIKVYTGLCVIDTETGKKARGFDFSRINVPGMSKGEIENIFPFLAPYDKAGGFSIEGAGSMIFDNIIGSYYNILGFPMMKLRELFTAAGLNILDFIKVK